MYSKVSELAKKAYDLAWYCFEHGELLNAYQILKSSPVIIRNDEAVRKLLWRVVNRVEFISSFQTNPSSGSGFIDPPNAPEKVLYKELLKRLTPEDKKVLDVGCYSGWLGRNLSLEGYSVHGIDLDPETMQIARLMATGTRATYEVLEASQVGGRYPKWFDVAVMFDVLEHVFDPILVLRSVVNATRRAVYINVPRFVDADIHDNDTPDIQKEHLRTFTEDDLKSMFDGKEFAVNPIVQEDGTCSWFCEYKI